jgi:hypothetical protein
MRQVEIRQRAWFGSLNRMAEELGAHRKTPDEFDRAVPAKELKRICREYALPQTAAIWLQITALTLFLAHQRAQPQSMAEIRKPNGVILDFEHLSKAISRVDFTVEWELDLWEEVCKP